MAAGSSSRKEKLDLHVSIIQYQYFTFIVAASVFSVKRMN